jgi:glucokinase
LVADVGGTHARFALADIDTGKIHAYRKSKVVEFESLEAAATNYLASVGYRPTKACFAVAGPVTDDVIRLTNANWSFTRDSIQRAAGLNSLVIANDYEALAHSLPYLTAGDLLQIGGEKARERSTKVVIGPGTGLGVAALAWSEERWCPISGEGGHTSFAATTAEEFAITQYMRKDYDHISAEMLISGPGLSRVYGILREMQDGSRADISAAVIVERAGDGSDRIAQRVTELFAGWLGSFAGDAALMFGARGGVYVAGGIPPRILDILIAGHFRKRFEFKGRMADYVKNIPAFVILNDDAGLRGAAAILAAASKSDVC